MTFRSYPFRPRYVVVAVAKPITGEYRSVIGSFSYAADARAFIELANANRAAEGVLGYELAQVAHPDQVPDVTVASFR